MNAFVPDSADSVRALGQRLSNWGRWGPDDELGTLNLVTADTVRDAAAAVRHGLRISCCIPVDDAGPFGARIGSTREPPRHVMTRLAADPPPVGFDFIDDEISMGLQAASHWDAIGHTTYDGKLYNGREASLATKDGLMVNSIERVAGQLTGRGVLLDVARLKGVACLPDSYAISAAELDDCARAAKVTIQPGDFVLARTGRVGRGLAEGWSSSWRQACPGLSLACAEWLKEHDVAAVAADNIGIETFPGEVPGCFLPLHMVAVRDMGMMFGEIWSLDPLAQACHDLRQYSFFLVAPALAVTGGAGSPVHPIAVL